MSLLLAVQGCTTGDKEYPIPSDLCGVKVGEDKLSPLLPRNSEINQSGNMKRVEERFCGVGGSRGGSGSGDFDLLLEVRIHGDNFGFDPHKAAGVGALQIADPTGIDIPGEAVIGEEGVIARVECYVDGEVPPIGIQMNDLILEIWVHEAADRGTGEDRLGVIEKFAQSYVDGLRDYLECDAR